MLGYLGYRAARGQWRSYRKSRKQPGGPWTFTAVLFCILPMTVLWMLAAAAALSAVFWALLGVNLILVLLALASSGLIGRTALSRQAQRKYDRVTARPHGLSPAALRERAALLQELQGQQKVLERRTSPPATPGASTAAREQRIADLFSVTCPEQSCRAPETVPCVMGLGIGVAIVRKEPLAFCHFERMGAAVRYGTATADDIFAQFGNNVPEGVW
jgi:hypothetical protein